MPGSVLPTRTTRRARVFLYCVLEVFFELSNVVIVIQYHQWIRTIFNETSSGIAINTGKTWRMQADASYVWICSRQATKRKNIMVVSRWFILQHSKWYNQRLPKEETIWCHMQGTLDCIRAPIHHEHWESWHITIYINKLVLSRRWVNQTKATYIDINIDSCNGMWPGGTKLSPALMLINNQCVLCH